MLEWFYYESDRGEQNIAECKTLYDLVERLQYRLEDMENEHMQLTREIADYKVTRYIGISIAYEN